MADPITSTAPPSLLDKFNTELNRQAALQGIPNDHDQLIVTARSDGRATHSIGVAVRTANQWTVGAEFAKQAQRGESFELAIGHSWKRK